MTIETWPPDFTLRKSAKAKRASIRISLYRKIEVVVPEETRFFDPHAFIEQHKSWILRQLARGVPEPAAFQMPTDITFPGLGRRYDVILNPDPDKRLSLRRGTDHIKLSGNFSDTDRVQDKLISWLILESGDLFLPHVLFLSHQHHLSVSELKVRFMKTRWGSCNRAGVMTLNAQLAFLPLTLIHHVILHELCHTRYMSHGPRFWSLLNKLDPATPAHDKALSQVHQHSHLPNWCIVNGVWE